MGRYVGVVLFLIAGTLGFGVIFSLYSSIDHNWWFNRHQPKDQNEYEEISVAEELSKRVRVLCWVMTQPDNHEKKARHVKATWGKRCNVLLFMSSIEDPSLPTIKLPVCEGYGKLWAKSKAAFSYIYEHHRTEADWFMKADDDTYVVVENLRYMLAHYASTSPIYFGCRLKQYKAQSFMSGGAGYVLSRAALDMFVEKGIMVQSNRCWWGDEGLEDFELGICLHNIGVQAMDSRDSLNRSRFLPMAPRDHLFPNLDKEHWYRSLMYYSTDDGLDCCSEHAISFHHVAPDLMYALDYLVYHQPYGIKYRVSERSSNSNVWHQVPS